MRVRWSESSLSDIDDIFSYIHERNRTAAVAVVEHIKAVAGLLQDFPEVGHLTDEPGVRMFPTVRYPYLIFYTVNPAEAEIVILHVRHGAQQPRP
ncbi:type II toxin-antitoxin system RelE/ParE family toxin [Bradyrhizobium symbiodeficiens]|uniref:Type II toxin-antitoxin system RelE/ParE family toxin n=1 Tax=Bradyrhizobium symbiodeficiens TaxID=1404367 RepID=A0A6G9A481_9BRAD|nr:type II toxin-antitoxin system RelE/ParE family toxin [Bradyrhizobium symbiodeficiens]QIP07023.1 type II toxin-antitoxin system RelE/ParE family toxin [Bradyrhizobium symbiodeficiens]